MIALTGSFLYYLGTLEQSLYKEMDSAERNIIKDKIQVAKSHLHMCVLHCGAFWKHWLTKLRLKLWKCIAICRSHMWIVSVNLATFIFSLKRVKTGSSNLVASVLGKAVKIPREIKTNFITLHFLCHTLCVWV